MPTKTKKVQAREACVVTVGARPVVYEKRIVRDRHSGKLAEIDIHELPPVDPGSEGTSYVYKKGEEEWSAAPAVLDSPSSFVPVDE